MKSPPGWTIVSAYKAESAVHGNRVNCVILAQNI